MAVPVLLFEDLPEDALLCPMIDARRMEVYAVIYDRALNVKREIELILLMKIPMPGFFFFFFLAEHPVYFFWKRSCQVS